MLIGGYLGAGKTTLLNHLLRNNEDRRIALLINDFGDINIDAQLIESQDENQINLANGCVCCTLSDGFFEAMEQLLAQSPIPDLIVVEASGVADVGNLAQYGPGSGLNPAGTLVVADADQIRAQANDKYVAQTIRRQLRAADLILLNKTDLCSAAQLRAVQDWLSAEIGPAPVIPTVRAEVPVALLTNLTPTAGAPSPEHHDHAAYASWSYASSGRFEPECIEAFMHQLPPGVVRAKGLFPVRDDEVLELQVVGQRKTIIQRNRPQTAVPTTAQIVAIGLVDHFPTTALDQLAQRLLQPSKTSPQA